MHPFHRSAAPWAAALWLALAVPATLHADFVGELELNGTQINNSTATAQFLASSAFTTNNNPNVFGSGLTASVLGFGGGNDVDFYAFQASAGSATFDIDGGGFDSYLALFGADGTLLGDSDDSFPGDPGSSSQFDAFLGTYTLPTTGLYFIAVARSGNFANATFSGSSFFQLVRPDGAFGGFGFVGATAGDSSFLNSGSQTGLAYTLHVSVVPAPGVLGLAAIVGLGTGRRRRRGRSS
jgi:MYXO-CTERM domain-containing protein